MEDQLVAHYRMVVHMIQTMLLRRVPRLMRPAAVGLSDTEMQDIAQLMARAHHISHQQIITSMAQQRT